MNNPALNNPALNDPALNDPALNDRTPSGRAADDPVVDCLSGRISPPVALARLLLAGADAAAIHDRVEAARADSDAWHTLQATLEGREADLDRLASGLADAALDPAALPGEGDTVARIAAFFDHAAALSPEAGVALYSLGDTALLDAATREVVDWLLSRDLLRRGDDVLDLGCGIGRMLPHLSARARSVIGLDLSPRMVAEARTRCTLPNVRVATTDGHTLDALAPDSLDLILAVDSLPYIVAAGPEVLHAHATGAVRALRPGGRMVVLNFSYRGDPARDAADAAALPGLTVLESGTTPFRLWDGTAFILRKPVTELVHLADRPDLAPVVAQWTWTAFWRGHGYTFEEVLGRISAGIQRNGLPQTFVALVDGVPAASASLFEHDMPERPNLTPWLAGVYTDPAFRNRNLATLVVRRVERAARESGFETLYLYTSQAEELYRKLGWKVAERVDRPGKPPVPVMRTTLRPA